MNAMIVNINCIKCINYQCARRTSCDGYDGTGTKHTFVLLPTHNSTGPYKCWPLRKTKATHTQTSAVLVKLNVSAQLLIEITLSEMII